LNPAMTCSYMPTYIVVMWY